MISLRRLVGAAVVIAATTATFAATTANADTAAPTPKAAKPQLCSSDDGRPDVTVRKFPYTMELGNSDKYPDGVRTCNYSGKREIVYRCDADPAAPPPILNVISNVDRGRRSVHRTVCDGEKHAIAPANAYKDRNSEFPGPFHLHWHVPDRGGWESAYLEVR